MTGDRFMPQLHLRQPGFTFSSSGLFIKHRETIQNFCCICIGSKDLAKNIVSNNFLKDRTYEIATNPKCDECQRRLASMVYKLLGEKETGAGVKATTKVGVSLNKVLAQELNHWLKNSNEGKSMRGLKIIFGQQIYFKWYHYLLRIEVWIIYVT